MRRLLGWIGLAAAAAGCAVADGVGPAPVVRFPPGEPAAVRPVPQRLPRLRGVVLVLGDGMGVGQVATASVALHGAAGGLFLESAPVTGLVRTHAADDLITDSAAAATAMASGERTRRRTVGIDPGGRPLPSLLEAARDAGLAVGVVTTSGLADATPAGFLAHVPHRGRYAEILEQELSFGADVLVGGDFSRYPGAWDDPRYRDVVRRAAELVPEGTAVVRTGEDLEEARVPVVALLPPRQGWPEQHGPPLEETALRALELLAADPDGFVLVVESEVTDEAGHRNDAAGVVAAVEELDRAVRTLVERAAALGEVAVVVTADHDTGGLAVVGGEITGGVARLAWLGHGHTALWVPVFAWGPGASAFAGVLDNTDLGRRIAALLGLSGAWTGPGP